MRASFKRQLTKMQNQLRCDIGIRFVLRIAQNSVSQSRSAAPFSANVENANPATDKVIIGIGVFHDRKEADESRGTGAVNIRKAFIDVSNKYEESFRQAYSVQIGGTTGLWEVLGVTDGTAKTQIRVSLQGRQ